jgi:ribosomal protein S18 acetylase RimI-like enzyme
MTGTPRVREATAADADAVQSVARASWHATYDDLMGESTVESFVDQWFDPQTVVEDDIEPPERELFVAEVDDAVSGFAETVPGDSTGVFHLYRIYVAPDAQGEGVGTALLERAETTAEAGGAAEFRVSVVAPNEDGVGFYEAKGFERVATVRDEQFDCDRYEYAKELG